VQLLDRRTGPTPTHCTGRFANRARCRCPNPTCTSLRLRPLRRGAAPPSSCSDRLKSTVAQRAIAAGEEPRPFGTPGFLFLDPPDHTRLRKLVSKAFSPWVVKALEPDSDGRRAAGQGGGRGLVEVIADLAYPLPVAVICRLLGVPIEDEPQFSWASALLAQGLDPFIAFTGQSHGFEERLEAGQWLRGYLRDLLERRRAEPADDLMSGLISVEEAGDQLTVEIIATCNLLLIAGHETTVNLIANAVLALLRHPDQCAGARRRPWSRRGGHRGDTALRPTGATRRPNRRCRHGDRLRGRRRIEVPKGDTMMLLLAAAHRDPAVTERPDEFDPDRPPSAIWRSGTDRTSASVRRWRGWRRRRTRRRRAAVPRRSPGQGTGP
jgi:cytochrome P450